MKYVKNSYLPLVVGGIVLLGLGLLIGLNVNKKEVYTKRDIVASNTEVSDSNNIEVVGEEKELKEDKTEIKDSSSTNKIPDNTVTNNVINNTTDTSTSNNSNINNSSSNNNAKDETTYSSNDQVVINSLEDTLRQVNASSNDETFADKAKGTFIMIVDFFFYDGEIEDITFSELTEDGKELVLDLASRIDEAIEAKIPGYKETISDVASRAFNKASELIKKGANNLSEFAREKLGEDNYNSIIEAKDELVYYTKNALNFIGDVGSKLFNSAKDKLNNWYQNFKNNN